MESIEQFSAPFSKKEDQSIVDRIKKRKENCESDKIKDVIDTIIIPKLQQINNEQETGINLWLIDLENELRELFLLSCSKKEAIDIDGKDVIFNSKEEVGDFYYIMFGHQMHEDENAKIKGSPSPA